MVKLIVVRHGYSQNNKGGRYTGQKDVPLDEIGCEQAKAVSAYIAEFFNVDRIYSSDLCRARDTVAPLAEVRGLPIVCRKDLREVDMGAWVDKTLEEIRQEFPESYAVYKKTPGRVRFDGGESHAEVRARVDRAFREIAAENEGKTVVVATHAGVVRALYAEWNHLPLDAISDVPFVPNGTISLVEWENDRAVWRCFGYGEFLTAKMSAGGIN